MTALYNEIRERFPEIHCRIYDGDEKLPYMLMGHLAEWLGSLPLAELTPHITKRLVSFCTWCEQQPRGEQAGDDLLTILMVGLYEKIFQFDSTRTLLPKLMSRKDLAGNAEYYRKWVGEANYKSALKKYNAG